MTFLLLLSTASAYESETQPVLLEDEATLFSSAEFSTGYVPSGSPIAVQFAIEALGGGHVTMEGEADLSWPNAFRLDYSPTPGGGMLDLDASLDAVTTIQIDLSDWGYKGVWELDRRSLPMMGEARFTPFLLDGSAEPRVEVVDPGRENELIYYSWEIVAGLSLDFAAYMRTETTVGFESVQYVVNGETLRQEGQAAALEPEVVADYLVDTVFTGAWDSTLDLVFTPSAEACTVFGCVTLLEFELPINLLTDLFEQDFPNSQQIFPLPLLVVGEAVGDLSDVPLGAIENLEVPLANDGSLTLTGTARIEGPSDFTVYPTEFTAIPGGADGLVVTFAPTVTGTQEAFLVLESNDPNQPQVVITLSANGLTIDEGVDVDDEQTQKPLSTCGCASSSTPAGWLWAAALGLLVARRRR